MRTRYGKTILGVAVVLVGAMAFVSLVFLMPVSEAEPLDTYHSSWHLVRETADEDEATFAEVYDLTGIGTTNGNFASKNTSTVLAGGAFRIPSRNAIGHEGYSEGGAWMFTICGKCYNDVDDTFSFNILGWSKTNGMMQIIAEGDGVLGTQAVVVYPDGGDALGELVSSTTAAYTFGDNTFTQNGAFGDVAVGMMARVTGSGLTNAIENVTTASANAVILTGLTDASDCTATIQINPSFWADTINLDETTKWPSVAVYNSGGDEVAYILVDTTGLEWIQFVIYAADAETNEEAGDITVYGRRY